MGFGWFPCFSRCFQGVSWFLVGFYGFQGRFKIVYRLVGLHCFKGGFMIFHSFWLVMVFQGGVMVFMVYG